MNEVAPGKGETKIEDKLSNKDARQRSRSEAAGEKYTLVYTARIACIWKAALIMVQSMKIVTRLWRVLTGAAREPKWEQPATSV